MISEMTSSATDRELENGELKTEIPFLAAWVRSTWLVPIQKHPITTSWSSAIILHEVRGTHVGTGVNDLGGDLGLGPDTDTLVLGEFLDQLLLGERPSLVVDLILVSTLDPAKSSTSTLSTSPSPSPPDSPHTPASSKSH